MRQRSLSSIGVILVGLVPVVFGGWVWAIAFTIIVAIAFREAIAITIPGARLPARLGTIVVAGTGVVAALDSGDRGLSLVSALAVGLPLVALVFAGTSNPIEQWCATAATSLYLAIPAYAAIDLRGDAELAARDWVETVAGMLPGVSTDTGGGLAWFLLALFVTWLSDTFAYLVGKTWGRHKLIPKVSPNKTVEGSAGGLVAAALSAVACDALFGMGIGAVLSLAIGLFLGAAGQVGDLSESMLKRARGVKDSSNLIPGHGGMLDRIDALIFVVVAAWLIAPVVS